MKRIVRFAAAGGLVAAICLSASPALASGKQTLPAGEALYEASCDGVYFTDQLGLVNPLDATVTAVGSSPLTTCFQQGAWDPATGVAYVVDNGLSNESLASVNLSTGVITDVAPFQLSPTGDVNVGALAISSTGAAFTTHAGVLYSVDLSTGQLTNPLPLVDGSSTPYFGLSALAFDPSNGNLYGITSDSSRSVVSIDPTTGLVTVLSQNPFAGQNALSLQFDSSGRAWIAVGSLTSSLYSASIDDVAGTMVLQGTLSYNGSDTPSISYLITPTVPAAPTGVSAIGGDQQVTVSWQASAAATSYTVTAEPGGGSCSASAPATSCSITGLTNGTAYSLSVTASNTLGTSPPATAAATPAAAAGGTTGSTVAPSALASTGAPLGFLASAGLLLCTGGGFVLLRRRRSAGL